MESELPSLCTMTTVSTATVVFLLEPVLLLTAGGVLVLRIGTPNPCNRIIVERAVFFTAVPAPASSTSSLLVESLCIQSTGKNIGACIIF